MLNCSCRKEVGGVKQDGVFRVKVVFHPEKLIFEANVQPDSQTSEVVRVNDVGRLRIKLVKVQFTKIDFV